MYRIKTGISRQSKLIFLQLFIQMSVVQSTNLFREKIYFATMSLSFSLKSLRTMKHLEAKTACLSIYSYSSLLMKIYTHSICIHTWKSRFILTGSSKSIALWLYTSVRLYCNEQSEGTLKYQVSFSIKHL